MSSPDAASAVAKPKTALRTWPPKPPPMAPAMLLPSGPKFTSLEMLPAALPPSAPAINCTIRAVRFIESSTRRNTETPTRKDHRRPALARTLRGQTFWQTHFLLCVEIPRQNPTRRSVLALRSRRGLYGSVDLPPRRGAFAVCHWRGRSEQRFSFRQPRENGGTWWPSGGAGRPPVAMRSPPDGAARCQEMTPPGDVEKRKDRDAKCPSLRVSLDSAHPANG